MSSPAPTDSAADDEEQAQLRAGLAHFQMDVAQFHEAVAQDPGWLGDLEIFLSKTLDRFDGPLRAKFPLLNALLTSAVPVPIAPFLLSMILLGVENGGLSILEKILDQRRGELERHAHPD